MTQEARRTGGLLAAIAGDPEPLPWHVKLRESVASVAIAVMWVAGAAAVAALGLLLCWSAMLAAAKMAAMAISGSSD